MEKSIGEQLGQHYKYYVLCFSCVDRLEGDKNFSLAMFGPQGLTDEDAVLVCIPFEEAALKASLNSLRATAVVPVWPLHRLQCGLLIDTKKKEIPKLLGRQHDGPLLGAALRV